MNISLVASTRKTIPIYLGIMILAGMSLGCSQKDPSFEQGKKIYENYCAGLSWREWRGGLV